MRRRPAPAFFNPFALWLDLAARMAEMLFASGLVIGHRTQRMARGDHSESVRMHTEKWKAAGDAAAAMGAQWQRAQLQLFAAALAPFHTASTANARRLTGAKTRFRAARRR